MLANKFSFLLITLVVMLSVPNNSLFTYTYVIRSVARAKCQSETVSFNSNFLEFIKAFFAIDLSQCSCNEPCKSVERYIRFYLYIPEINSFQKLYADGSNAYLIDRTKPTTIFVHGYSDSFKPKKNSWNNELCRIESKVLQRNTIAVDWGKISRCQYKYATEFLVPQIGYHLHYTLKNVLQIKEAKVNCVGHSLGAHVCGYAGAASGGQFNRCYGLDPAGIGYSTNYNGPPRGLNKTCCQYVQAIHTDQLVGSLQAMGHVDFYPNNSTGLQTHCAIQTTGCSHQSVVEYYKASLDSSNKFIGKKCKPTHPEINCEFGALSAVDCTGVACFDTSPCAPYTN